jgi:hypothetical protein
MGPVNIRKNWFVDEGCSFTRYNEEAGKQGGNFTIAPY